MIKNRFGRFLTAVLGLAFAFLMCVTNAFNHAPALGDTMTEKQKNDKDSARASNIGAARQFNGASAGATGGAAGIKLSNGDQKTADNSGGQSGPANSKSAASAPEAAPVKGFHPIKKMLQPVENLEGMSIKLEQQIMKLEGPIAGLNAPMVRLQNKMNNVNDSMDKMQGQLNGVDQQMHGVRSDLSGMRSEIAEIKQPIYSIQKPLAGVSRPLEAVEQQLNLVLFAIVVCAIVIVIGTPIAAMLTYRYRHKLFPPETAAALPEERQKVLH